MSKFEISYYYDDEWAGKVEERVEFDGTWLELQDHLKSLRESGCSGTVATDICPEWYEEENEEEEEMTIHVPEITTHRFWTPDRVRSACIRNQLYTRGDNAAYSKMLEQVGLTAGMPTPANLYLIAKDIYEHSKDQTITNIMFILESETVITTFEVDGRDDI